MDNKMALSRVRDAVQKAMDKVGQCANNGHDGGHSGSPCTKCANTSWLALCDIAKILKA